ncbi:MAG: molybdopterin-dependent oxidoreductase [Bryobacteraceae bacterium]
MAELIRRAVERGAVATAMGLAVHYAAFYLFGVPLWTEVIGEWIMARTPNAYSVWLLTELGAWAKPFALTGGLAALGLVMSVGALFTGWRSAGVVTVAALAFGMFFGYQEPWKSWTFWLPGLMALLSPAPAPVGGRRMALRALMGGATLAVAGESFWRDGRLARRAVKPMPLWPFAAPAETFGADWVRRAVTQIGQHFTMSKNSVDPAIDPTGWALRVTIDGRQIASFRYAQLLQVPCQQRYVTLRCVSNTLKSDLMGTAEWSGFLLRQIVDRSQIPDGITEVAFIGVDGHGDSLPVDYAFSDEVMLAIGMNGETLNRSHGFPLRLLCPRYYGFKNVKWLGEIAFVTKPYFGTWPKMGYTKEPLVKIASFIDNARREGGKIRLGGVSYAGSRGIRAVEVRVGGGDWKPATMENPLSPYTWTRWVAVLDGDATVVEARAQDGTGAWQLETETPLFPSGVGGPTLRTVSI